MKKKPQVVLNRVDSLIKKKKNLKISDSQTGRNLPVNR